MQASTMVADALMDLTSMGLFLIEHALTFLVGINLYGTNRRFPGAPWFHVVTALAGRAPCKAAANLFAITSLGFGLGAMLRVQISHKSS